MVINIQVFHLFKVFRGGQNLLTEHLYKKNLSPGDQTRQARLSSQLVNLPDVHLLMKPNSSPLCPPSPPPLTTPNFKLKVRKMIIYKYLYTPYKLAPLALACKPPSPLPKYKNTLCSPCNHCYTNSCFSPSGSYSARKNHLARSPHKKERGGNAKLR